MTWAQLRELVMQAPDYVLEQEVILVFENRFWNPDRKAWQTFQEQYTLCAMEADDFNESYPRIQFKARK